MGSGRSWRCEAALLLTIGSLFALGVGAAYAQGPVTYSTPALRGRVVAKETASPLAGAHVLAAWQGNEAQPLIRPATVKLLETATAPDGSFWVPAWGPESLPTPIYWQSPTVVVFLPGYEPWRLDLGLEFRGNEAKIRDPLDIRLSRFEKKPEDWAQHLSEATWVLAYFAAPLKPMPQLRMLSAVEAEWRRLPEDRLPEEIRKRKLTLRAAFDMLVEEFRRAIEYEALEKK